MLPPHCPRCGADVPADSAELVRRCPACGAWCVARADARPRPAPARRRWRRWLALALLLGLGAGGVALYATSRKDVHLYVDNGLGAEAVVRVDGREVERVPARTLCVVPVWSGERRVEVQVGGATVFDEVKTLRPPHSRKKPTRYLLNPGQANRYRRYVAEYGRPPKSPADLDPLSPDFDPANARQRTYARLARAVKLVAAADWMEVDDLDYVLEAPPSAVPGAVYARRSALGRLATREYEVLDRARRNPAPKQEDFEELKRVVEAVLARPR